MGYININEEIGKSFREIAKWSDVYDMNFQMYNGEYNVYLSKKDIDVFGTGGHENPEDALKETLKWIKRVNKSQP